MRPSAIAALVFAALGLTASAGCGVRKRPYRFASPMLGTASVPPPPLPGEPPPPTRARRRDPDTRIGPAIRIATAPRIREASAAAALAIAASPAAREGARSSLPAPHALPASAPLPTVRTPDDLRTLVGRRDPRDPIAAALGWARDLGAPLEALTTADLRAWAERTTRLSAPTATAQPGDLLVFDHVTSDAEGDLVAVVIARDARGVTEFVYLGGGVIRRGFVDATRPSLRRDSELRVVNSFVRHGKRWPARGSHYLAGELLAHVVHLR
ncbi:MAG: hypothetical protein SFX73_36605 [Kofleriaceae bacterium]|nr:hypothetical protein [Kofleriaceae bacterium]